jgi:hypothetical protein
VFNVGRCAQKALHFPRVEIGGIRQSIESRGGSFGLGFLYFVNMSKAESVGQAAGATSGTSAEGKRRVAYFYDSKCTDVTCSHYHFYFLPFSLFVHSPLFLHAIEIEGSERKAQSLWTIILLSLYHLLPIDVCLSIYSFLRL